MPTKTWVTIELIVLPGSMRILVDGQERQRVDADFPKVDQPFGIRAHSSPLQVKSVRVSHPAG